MLFKAPFLIYFPPYLGSALCMPSCRRQLEVESNEYIRRGKKTAVELAIGTVSLRGEEKFLEGEEYALNEHRIVQVRSISSCCI